MITLAGQQRQVPAANTERILANFVPIKVSY